MLRKNPGTVQYTPDGNKPDKESLAKNKVLFQELAALQSNLSFSDETMKKALEEVEKNKRWNMTAKNLESFKDNLPFTDSAQLPT